MDVTPEILAKFEELLAVSIETLKMLDSRPRRVFVAPSPPLRQFSLDGSPLWYKRFPR